MGSNSLLGEFHRGTRDEASSLRLPPLITPELRPWLACAVGGHQATDGWVLGLVLGGSSKGVVYVGICMGMGESGVYRSKFGLNGGEFCVDLVALVNQLAFFFG